MSTRHSKVSDALVRTIIGPPELTSVEVVEQAGVDMQDAWRFWRALGFPRVPRDARVFTKQDVAMLRAGIDVLEREGAESAVLLQIVRASGQALARMAAVQVAPIAREVLHSMRSRELSDTEAVDNIVGAGDQLLTTAEPFVSYAWRRHLAAQILQLSASGASDVSEARELTVGFADLVGFTASCQELGNRDIARTVDRFERLAYDCVPEFGGTVVKMIGDEVLFTADAPAMAAEIALGLLESCAADEIVPDVRVGLATGPTLLWQGDVYGPTVNLASRLVNIARPGTVLAGERSGESLEEAEGFVVRRTPRVNLKGIGRTRPLVVRRTASSD